MCSKRMCEHPSMSASSKTVRRSSSSWCDFRASFSASLGATVGFLLRAWTLPLALDNHFLVARSILKHRNHRTFLRQSGSQDMLEIVKAESSSEGWKCHTSKFFKNCILRQLQGPGDLRSELIFSSLTHKRTATLTTLKQWPAACHWANAPSFGLCQGRLAEEELRKSTWLEILSALRPVGDGLRAPAAPLPERFFLPRWPSPTPAAALQERSLQLGGSKEGERDRFRSRKPEGTPGPQSSVTNLELTFTSGTTWQHMQGESLITCFSARLFCRSKFCFAALSLSSCAPVGMGMRLLVSKASTATAFLSRWRILHDDANDDVPCMRCLTLNFLRCLDGEPKTWTLLHCPAQ